jgi:hypothetical protein
MAGDQMGMGQIEHARDRNLGDLGQIVADHHQRDGLGQISGGDAQLIALGELVQPLHLLFQILGVDMGQQGIEFGFQTVAAQGRVEPARVEQLVEQQRMTPDLLGEPGTEAGEPDQVREDQRMLGEHRQIGGAPHHGFQHPQYPLKGQIGMRAPGRDAEHMRHDQAQTLVSARTQTLAHTGLAKLLDTGADAFGIGEAGAFE